MQDALKLNETSCGASKSRVKKSVSYNNKNRPIIILLLYSKLVCHSYIYSLREWPALGSWIIAMHALPTHFFPCFLFSFFLCFVLCSYFLFFFYSHSRLPLFSFPLSLILYGNSCLPLVSYLSLILRLSRSASVERPTSWIFAVPPPDTG